MWFLILLLAPVWADKLDQVYLPPPGAATAGGYPGDISAPLPAGPGEPTVIPILSYDNKPNSGDGSYSYSYETANGIKASEEGAIKEGPPPDGAIQTVHGVYSYTGPDGVLYTIAYTADENGFVARGDHLPTAPPIPPEILQSLEQNAAEEAAAAAAGTPDPAGPTAAPAQVGYFKNIPLPNYNYNYNRHYNQYNKYYHRRY